MFHGETKRRFFFLPSSRGRRLLAPPFFFSPMRARRKRKEAINLDRALFLSFSIFPPRPNLLLSSPAMSDVSHVLPQKKR